MICGAPIVATPPERNYGCRISADYHYRGLRTVVIENKSLRVSVLADKGTDIFEFLYKPLDIDFMYRAPAGVRNPGLAVPSIANPSGAYLDYWHGGWQEAFPTGGWPCQHRGASFGLHGEVSLIPWNWRIFRDTKDGVGVQFDARTMRSPFLISKTLTLEGESSVLRISERITNEGRTPAHFVWGHHPVLGPPFLDDSCAIIAPAETVLVPDAALWPNGRLRSGRYRWPLADDRSGDSLDASRVLPFDAGTADGMYLTDLREGWCAVSNVRLGLAFALSWTKDVFSHIWVWHVAGGETDAPFFGRNYNLAIEPFTSLPAAAFADLLTTATDASRTLGPGESIEATVSAAVVLLKGSIAGVSPEGVVHFV